EVTVLHGAVDVHHAPGVVVRDDGHAARALDGGHVAQNLGPGRGVPADRNILQVLEGLDRILRSLGDQAVVHPVLPVEELHGGDLIAPAEREEHAVRNVAGGEAGPRGLGAVHAHLQLRVVEILVDAEIGETGNPAKLVEDLVGDLPVALDVGPFDLHVDGRRKTEVQDLRHDVGGHEVEGNAGKLLGQPAAERAHVILGRSVTFLQRHQDVRVGGADEAGAAVHVVDGAVRETDVVDDVVQ